MTIKVNVPNFVNLNNLASERATDIAIARIKEEAVTNAPAVTGELRRNIVDDYQKKEVRAEAKHSAPVEYGTAPHTITAKGKALRFVVDGKTVFTKKVNHPGTKPQPFMRLSARKVQKEIPSIYKRELEKVK